MATKAKPAAPEVKPKAKPAAPEVKPKAKPATPKFAIPKSLAQCADLLYNTRAERYALNKQVEALEAKESLLREHLINTLPKSSATGVAGHVARATVENKTVVTVADYDKLHGYILANAKKNPGVWALLQKRISDSTVKEMWAAKKKIPGVASILVPFVSLNKL